MIPHCGNGLLPISHTRGVGARYVSTCFFARGFFHSSLMLTLDRHQLALTAVPSLLVDANSTDTIIDL